MKPAKSINSLSSQQAIAASAYDRRKSSEIQPQHQSANNNNNAGPTSPICRCRVMYLGSSVPHITKDGLQGIQEPLRELYPDSATLSSGNAGIDSWLSVWSNGILIENVDESGREVKRFFKIDALHYCAAVKFVSLPPGSYSNNGQTLPNFLPLDSPHARQSDSSPPVFASILRRTTGIKVLECHAFICKREAAANALVRCCFHAYADTMYAKQIGADLNEISNDINNNQTNYTKPPSQLSNGDSFSNQPITSRRSKSIANLNEQGQQNGQSLDTWGANGSSRGNNIKNKQDVQLNQQENLMHRRKSVNEHYLQNCDTENSHLGELQRSNNEQLRKQQKLSKSMHHLNNQQLFNSNYSTMNNHTFDNESFNSHQLSSTSCMNIPNGVRCPTNDHKSQVPLSQPFYNPYAGRVPSYPPQNIIDSANNGGTLKSIRSMAANSIASTLLRSKKHAKAMSMAQLNHDKITSFHQPNSNATTMIGSMVMPPIPPMFLPNLPHHTIINGSQTMKAPSRHMIPIVGPPMNFEAMTPKEMKKLLKKSAKYGIDPTKFGENGLPLLPLRPTPLPPNMIQSSQISQHSKSGTMVSQSMLSEIYSSDVPDLASLHGLPPPMLRGPIPMLDPLEAQQMKPILVKPNPEFLKSKAGKKWLKQQKEFKKLLPPHLDGLPIIFGPPPIESLEPAIPNQILPPPPNFLTPHQGLPKMDSSGYYNPHSIQAQNGRASAASTLLRYSPHNQPIHNGMNGFNQDLEYMNRNHMIYSNGFGGPHNMSHPREFVDDVSSIIYGNTECGPDMHIRQIAENEAKHQRRNHMVEQSIISLGDENDYDDEESDERQQDYYNASTQGSEMDSHSRRSKTSQSVLLNDEHMSNSNLDKRNTVNQHGYDQQLADDQGSYSSGIYKKGHINERAFSYSIRQEHRSGGEGRLDTDYATRNDNISNKGLQQSQECRHDGRSHNGNVYQNKLDCDYYHSSTNGSQAIPVNELTSRLENQLSMKSFANSRVKSHI